MTKKEFKRVWGDARFHLRPYLVGGENENHEGEWVWEIYYWNFFTFQTLYYYVVCLPCSLLLVSVSSANALRGDAIIAS